MMIILQLFNNIRKYIFSHDYTFTKPVIVKKHLNKEVNLLGICIPRGLVWHLSQITGTMK